MWVQQGVRVDLRLDVFGVFTHAFLLFFAVARGDAGVLSQRQSGAGGLQAGHEDGRRHAEGTLQTAPHPRHPRAGETAATWWKNKRIGEKIMRDGASGRRDRFENNGGCGIRKKEKKKKKAWIYLKAVQWLGTVSPILDRHLLCRRSEIPTGSVRERRLVQTQSTSQQ